MLGVIVVIELLMVITAGLGVAATVLATRMFQMDRKTVEFDSDFVEVAKVELVVTHSFQKKGRTMLFTKQLEVKRVRLRQER